MTFLQALYGSQYQEIAGRGGDTNKARINGNYFLTAFAILGILISASLVFYLFKAMGIDLSARLSQITGSASGKGLGRLMAIPLFLLIYLVIGQTIGSKARYEQTVAEFMQLPKEERETANKRVLKPFFILLILFVALIFLG